MQALAPRSEAYLRQESRHGGSRTLPLPPAKRLGHWHIELFSIQAKRGRMFSKYWVMSVLLCLQWPAGGTWTCPFLHVPSSWATWWPFFPEVQRFFSSSAPTEKAPQWLQDKCLSAYGHVCMKKKCFLSVQGHLRRDCAPAPKSCLWEQRLNFLPFQWFLELPCLILVLDLSSSSSV